MKDSFLHGHPMVLSIPRGGGARPVIMKLHKMQQPAPGLEMTGDAQDVMRKCSREYHDSWMVDNGLSRSG